MATKTLTKTKTNKFDAILLRENGIDNENKAGNLTKEEKVEIKSYSIKKAVKLQKYKL